MAGRPTTAPNIGLKTVPSFACADARLAASAARQNSRRRVNRSTIASRVMRPPVRIGGSRLSVAPTAAAGQPVRARRAILARTREDPDMADETTGNATMNAAAEAIGAALGKVTGQFDAVK